MRAIFRNSKSLTRQILPRLVCRKMCVAISSGEFTSSNHHRSKTGGGRDSCNYFYISNFAPFLIIYSKSLGLRHFQLLHFLFTFDTTLDYRSYIPAFNFMLHRLE